MDENEHFFGPVGCKLCNKKGEDTPGTPPPAARAPSTVLRKALARQQEPPLLAAEMRFPVPELHRIPFTGYKAYRRMYHAVKTARGISPAGNRAKRHSIPSPSPVINKEIEVQASQTTFSCQGIH